MNGRVPVFLNCSKLYYFAPTAIYPSSIREIIYGVKKAEERANGRGRKRGETDSVTHVLPHWLLLLHSITATQSAALTQAFIRAWIQSWLALSLWASKRTASNSILTSLVRPGGR